MVDNYGYTFSFNNKEGRRVRRKSKIYRTKSDANKGVKSFKSFFGRRVKNPRVVKATKQEYKEYTSLFQTGRI